MRLRLLGCGSALLLAACGSGGNAGNAAAGASFNYGLPSAATPLQAAAMETSVGSSSSFAAAPSADGGLMLADPSSVTDALLGASGFGIGTVASAPPAGALVAPGGAGNALAGAGFDNPACAIATATSVTLSGCTITIDQVSGGITMHAVVTATGSVSYDPATHTLDWGLQVGEHLVMSGTTSGSADASFNLTGSLTVTDTAIAGHMESGLFMTASASGQTMRAGVDESVVVDVTYTDPVTCPTRVTAGTVEAKRVWTARPQGATPADLPDAAAKITFTGCGAATVQYGTR